MEYKFPVKDKFEAREVTELDFQIDPLDDSLYVNLDSVRSRDFIDRIHFILNIGGECLRSVTKSYCKIIFSGHKGSGKSIELARFHAGIDDPERYFSAFIEIANEMEVGSFQAEDLFVILISNLMERISKEGIEFDSDYLADILKEWVSEEEIKKELKNSFKVDIASEISAGNSFFGFIKLKAALKSIFSSSSETSKTIRQAIKRNPLSLIERFNDVLSDLREKLKTENKAKDILFILDGTEKIPYEIYQKLFVKDSHLIRGINANMIFSVPINSYFDIESNPSSDFFQTFSLPMVKITDESRPLLKKIISKRIDLDSFIEDGALEYCVEKSGGCIRQLIRIVNRAITIGMGAKITRATAEKSVAELGESMKDPLTSEHLAILRSGEFYSSDPAVLDLLFSLAVLKYNGKRGINPLLIGMDFLNE